MNADQRAPEGGEPLRDDAGTVQGPLGLVTRQKGDRLALHRLAEHDGRRPVIVEMLGRLQNPDKVKDGLRVVAQGEIAYRLVRWRLRQPPNSSDRVGRRHA